MAQPFIWEACAFQGFSCEAVGLYGKHCNTHPRSSLGRKVWGAQHGFLKERKGTKEREGPIPASSSHQRTGLGRLGCWPVTDAWMAFLSSVPDSSKTESPPYSAVVRVPKAAEVEWILDLNEEENELVRSEFYYEQVRAIKSEFFWCVV